MAKILILAESGFGKTSSIGPITDLKIAGLNPKETFIITATNKGLSIPGWNKMYTLALPEDMTKGNLIMNVSKNPDIIGRQIINAASREYIKNILLDDTNYIMQDYYMQKAITGGYDVFKKIGQFMGNIFTAMDNVPNTKNFIMMAHHEEYKNSNMDSISFRFKTVGTMVQNYITPEGKFEIVLFGKQSFKDENGKRTIIKQFVTNYDGQYPAKSPYGMFKQLYIPNDLGYVVDAVDAYMNGEEFYGNKTEENENSTEA